MINMLIRLKETHKQINYKNSKIRITNKKIRYQFYKRKINP